MLSVTDTGHGMDAATLQRMWEPFFTTKPVGHGHRARALVGLRPAKQSGGFVWADSEPGRGTTVQVYWPETARRGRAAALEPERRALGGRQRDGADRGGRGAGAGPGGAGAPELRLHAATRRATRGEALRLLDEPAPRVDLVVTDVVMPGMSGGGLGDRLARASPGHPGAVHVGVHRRRRDPARDAGGGPAIPAEAVHAARARAEGAGGAGRGGGGEVSNRRNLAAALEPIPGKIPRVRSG